MGSPVGPLPSDPESHPSHVSTLPNRTEHETACSNTPAFRADRNDDPIQQPSHVRIPIHPPAPQHHNHQPPTDRNGSPADSLRSNHMSIESLRDDDDSSSLADSDSDFDGDKVPAFIVDAMRNGAAAIPQTSNGMVVINNGVSTVGKSNILSTTSNSRPNIGSIALQNSSDITFGDKTFYQGPVTVKQFFLEKTSWRSREDSADGATTQGCDNAAFVTSDELQRKEAKDLSGDPIDTGRTGCWQKLMELERNPLMLTVIVTAGLILFVVLAAIAYLVFRSQDMSGDHAGDGEDSRLNIPVESSIGMDIITGYVTPFRFIARPQWLAQPPKAKLDALVGPAFRVIIAHTATTSCVTQAECIFQVRTIQTFHMESMNFDDIGYNFLVGGDGAVYEARGWDTQGAHTFGFNRGSICISFIGTFTQHAPPERQLQVALLLIEDGLRKGKLTSDYKLYGHRQLMGTESPGKELYDIVKTWPHWTDTLNAADAAKLSNTNLIADASAVNGTKFSSAKINETITNTSEIPSNSTIP